MTKKKDPNLSLSEALSLSWKNRKNYKGYDRSKGSKYNSWRSIVNTKRGKEIGFPDEWKSYDKFDSDTLYGWEKGKILCRKDTQKPYSKDNVEWRDKGQEQFCKLVKLEYNGETKTILEWCSLLGLNYNGVRQRYFKGKNFTTEQILFGKYKKLSKTITDIKDITDEDKRRNKANKMLAQYKLYDKKKGFEFDIDRKWFVNAILYGRCHYCGDTKRLGLDRIDNNKGHTHDNVVVCCYECNVARGNNFSYEEMLILGKTIKEIKNKRKKKFI